MGTALPMTSAGLLQYSRFESFPKLVYPHVMLISTEQELGVNVMGVIGILDKLLADGIIGRSAYDGSLRKLMETNSRLPRKNILQRIGGKDFDA